MNIKKKSFVKLYFLINFLLLFVSIYGYSGNKYAEPELVVYLITLSIICSSPLLFINGFRGPGILITAFLAFFFATFGMRDLFNLIYGGEFLNFPRSMIFTMGEWVIVISALSYITGYLICMSLATRRVNASKQLISKDWAHKQVLIFGLMFWAIGSVINVYIQFKVGDHYLTGAPSNSILVGSFGGVFALLRNLQPLGSIFFIYLFLVKKNRIALILLIVTAGIDFVQGFLGDTKEVAIRTPLLFLFSWLIIREKIPVLWLLLALVLFSSTFALFDAYRSSLGLRQETREDAAKNIGSRFSEVLDQTAGSRLKRGFEYLTSRITLKHNIELLANEVGESVSYLDGETIYPLVYAFIPRIMAPNKPDASGAGRIFNQEFHISPNPDTYISISHSGDLYWNFGWVGLIIGMVIIGSVMALVASLCRMDIKPNLPKFIILLMTIYLLILRFETGIAGTYTYWMRLLVLILLIHMFMFKEKKQPGSKRLRNTSIS